jgi:hypothetical protein
LGLGKRRDHLDLFVDHLSGLSKKGGRSVKTCNLDDFLQELNPWLSGDYIREVYLDEKGQVVVMFLDGVRNGYHIDDCTQAQVKEALSDLKEKGLAVRE